MTETVAIDTASATGSKVYRIFDKWAGFFVVLSCVALPVSVSATDIALSLSMILGLISAIGQKRVWAVFAHPVVKVALVLYGLVCLGMFWGHVPWHYTTIAVHKYLKLLFIPLLLLIFYRQPIRRYALNAFIIGNGIMVLMSFLKLVGLLPFWHHDPGGIFINSIYASFLLAFACYALADRVLMEKKGRYVYGCMWVAFTCWLFLINPEKTGYLVYFALMVCLLIQHFSRKVWKQPSVLCGVIFFIVSMGGLLHYSPVFDARLSEAVNQVHVAYRVGLGEDNTSLSTIGFRFQFASYSWSLIKQRPLLGHGTGSFFYQFTLTGHQAVPKWKGDLHTPHNDYLLFAVQFGLLGLVLFLYFFYKPWRLSFSLADDKHRLQALVVAIMVGMCCNAMLYLSSLGNFYVLMLSAFVSSWFDSKNAVVVDHE